MFYGFYIFSHGLAFLVCALATASDACHFYAAGGKRRFCWLLFEAAGAAYFGKHVFRALA
jgi:hypothetical protein